jgi:hypothetical protein
LNSRPLDVDVLLLLSFKNIESEKKMNVDLKGVSSTHVLWAILLSFVWAAGGQRK